ncbi:hypothetical protein [Actinoplanes sp. NPDC020271]|uniref:hypothetical protein n=1 Tax=Actinoplanes sp. NPDC020271 TaxID=3363896 RepID=UPI00378AC727
MAVAIRNPGGRLPASGDLLHVDRQTSVQFTEPFKFRVIRLERGPVTYGWCWVHGYVLNELGDAVEERDLFLQVQGLLYLDRPGSSLKHGVRPQPGRGNRGDRHHQPGRSIASRESR